MKTPNDVVKGRIVDINEKTGSVLIEAQYDDWETLIKRGYRNCNVQMIDSRPLSDKQRKFCYKLLHEIADYAGMGIELTKENLKIKFLTDELQETADNLFSLSNAPMSLVCAFQKFLIRFVLDYEIPCSFRIVDYVDDVQDYIYACAERKKCCVCGMQAEPHHAEHIGMGRNRDTLDQTGMLMEPLCRRHHRECHDMPQDEFNEKYHIKPVVIDDTLKRVYGFNGKRRRSDWMDDWGVKEKETA